MQPNPAPLHYIFECLPISQVDFKYLSPLVKSLEDQVAMKTQELNSLKVSSS